MNEASDVELKERRLNVGEVELFTVEAGEGPLVVLLHGFPEFWGSWRHQLSALARAGFRAVAPDLRGYHRSDKPRGVSAYSLDKLTGDVAGLIRALGEERAAAVVGHDWGGAIAWRFAMDYPKLFEQLVIMNVPHPVMMEKGLRTLRQLVKSWYMFFFQLPAVPEAVFRAGNFRMTRESWKREGLTNEDIQRLVEALSVPDGVTGPMNYYRSAMRDAARGRTAPPLCIEHPVLVIWGELDAYLGKELAVPPADLVPHARVEFLPDASHWVQNHRPERVNELLIGFLRQTRTSQGHVATAAAEGGTR